MKFLFNVGDNVEVSSISSLIDTVFFVEIYDVNFPDSLWTDCPCIVLEMWKTQLIAHENCERAKFKLYFFDGPYYLCLEKNKDNVKIDFVDDHGKGKIVYSFEYKYFELFRSLHDAFKRLSYVLYKNGLHSGICKDDYEQTLISIEELKRKIGHY